MSKNGSGTSHNCLKASRDIGIDDVVITVYCSSAIALSLSSDDSNRGSFREWLLPVESHIGTQMLTGAGVVDLIHERLELQGDNKYWSRSNYH